MVGGGGRENQGTTMSKCEACQYRFRHVFCRHNVAACQGNYLTRRHFFLLKLTKRNWIFYECRNTELHQHTRHFTLLYLSLCFSEESLTRNMARKISTLRYERVCDISSLHYNIFSFINTVLVGRVGRRQLGTRCTTNVHRNYDWEMRWQKTQFGRCGIIANVNIYN